MQIFIGQHCRSAHLAPSFTLPRFARRLQSSFLANTRIIDIGVARAMTGALSESEMEFTNSLSGRSKCEPFSSEADERAPRHVPETYRVASPGPSPLASLLIRIMQFVLRSENGSTCTYAYVIFRSWSANIFLRMKIIRCRGNGKEIITAPEMTSSGHIFDSGMTLFVIPKPTIMGNVTTQK